MHPYHQICTAVATGTSPVLYPYLCAERSMLEPTTTCARALGLISMDSSGTNRFADVLRRYRMAAGMSQDTLAERAGISVESIGKLERGKYTVPRFSTVSLLADALSLTPEQRASLLAAARPFIDVPRFDEGPAMVVAAPVRGELVGSLHGLSSSLTPLLGREHEEAAITRMLQGDRVRLLTITGPGGVGKTRLAVQVASAARTSFPEAVCFVGLAALREPDLVLPTIGQALGLRERDDLPLTELLATHLGSRQTLLVLDNFEHLMAAATDLSLLLAQCPALRVLATSRAPLRVRGEQEFALHPLSIPVAGKQLALDELEACAAIRLFVQRVTAVQPGFELSTGNIAAVTSICRRLDGLPLALELAAPYLKLFTPAELLARLSQRLKVLTGGSRDLPARQQTLHATLDWSHALLSGDARVLLGRLGVFDGGASLSAFEAVCAVDGDLDVLAGVRMLQEHSLLVRLEDGEQTRFDMLETVREYALECLVGRGDEEKIRRAHADYYLGLAEEADAHIRGAEQAVWLRRLEVERDNLRAALAWSISAGECAIALRFGTALGRFWVVRGHLREGSSWMDQALSLPCTDRGDWAAPAPSLDGIRAKALTDAAALAIEQGRHIHASLRYEESLRLYRALDDRTGYALALNGLGSVAQLEGDHERARVLFAESLAIARAVNDRACAARALNNLGLVAQVEGRYEQAVALHEESLAIKVALGNERGIAASLHNLGEVAFLRGELSEAAERFAESAARKHRLGANEGMVVSLDSLAAVFSARGRYEQAARFLGAAAALRTALGASQKLALRPQYAPTVKSVRDTLGEEMFAVSWQAGAEQPLDEIVAEAQQLAGASHDDGA
jgi:predicted ATPase/transcriptional regulator with XRE-family HTH domain